MIIAINTIPNVKPWGGGNNFILSLEKYMTRLGHVVKYELTNPVDVILIFDYRASGTFLAFSWKQARNFKHLHPSTVVVHRINECDERKGTQGVNWRLRRVNKVADGTVFVSSWLRSLNVWHRGNDGKRMQVIHNGADREVFGLQKITPWNGQEKLKIVTHHWSDNWLKGHDVYLKLDQILGTKAFKDRFEFTYIGKVPKKARYCNSTILSPMSREELCSELSTHHAYITASINEPGSNHQAEAAMVGLPVMYRPSGSLIEYCQDFGFAVEKGTLEKDLLRFRDNYDEQQAKVDAYQYDAERMIRNYQDFFKSLKSNIGNSGP